MIYMSRAERGLEALSDIFKDPARSLSSLLIDQRMLVAARSLRQRRDEPRHRDCGGPSLSLQTRPIGGLDCVQSKTWATPRLFQQSS